MKIAISYGFLLFLLSTLVVFAQGTDSLSNRSIWFYWFKFHVQED